MSSQQRAVVVGAGLVGAAAARRLSERGLSVTCIGPVTGEPPYSSHDDSSRLTRVLDADPIWAMLASRSIAEYADLEAKSGKQFHWPVGVLWSATTPAPLAQLVKVGAVFDVKLDSGLGGWDETLSVDPELTMLERGQAGYINPRRMLIVHQQLAVRAGARFVNDVVSSISKRHGIWLVDVGGETIDADLVVVAAGAASGGLVDVPITVTAEVVMEVFVDADAETFRHRSCLVRFDSGGHVPTYLTPPVMTESGWVLELGSETPDPAALPTPEAVRDWMCGTAHNERAAEMLSALSRLLPELRVSRAVTKPCMYTRTASGFPIVDELHPGLFVATGGNGRMAKSADAVAEMAVTLAVDGMWDHEIPRERFRVGAVG